MLFRSLVVLDYDQIDADSFNDSMIKEIMNKNLEELNRQLSSYEKLTEIILYPNEFEKTPKKSIKRYLYN